MNNFTVFTILDGFGIGQTDYGNAISAASTPNLDKILQKYPHASLGASGMSVGLPEGQMGNSEVGHLNIGAGRIIYQDFTRITKAIQDGGFFENQVLSEAMEHTVKNNSTLHLMGLLSDGGVHSHISHLFAIIDMAKAKGVKKLCVHCFLDGRDVPPRCAEKYIHMLEEHIKKTGLGKIASIAGRYYAMDRDKRWERIEKAYDMMTQAHSELSVSDKPAQNPPEISVSDKPAQNPSEISVSDAPAQAEITAPAKTQAQLESSDINLKTSAQNPATASNTHAETLAPAQPATFASAGEALAHAYAQEENDEFVLPRFITGGSAVSDNDSIIMFNFRPDRAREITRTFCDHDFDGFHRKITPENLKYVCMTQYDAAMPNVSIAFPPQHHKNTLGEYIAAHGKKQIRIAETEKYAHVTFFFNGGLETPNINEDRILIPSPKVATYDLQPEMSAPEVTRAVLEAIKSEKYDLIIVNFANPDMVGHTGVFDAAVKAIETVDNCIGRIYDAVSKAEGNMLIAADHGNADTMADESGNTITAHSTNPVPVILITPNGAGRNGNAAVNTDYNTEKSPGESEKGNANSNTEKHAGKNIVKENSVKDSVSQIIPHKTESNINISNKPVKLRTDGILADLAPTILQLMDLPQPAEMTGRSLIE